MKITYEVKVADCLAFNDHHLKTSPFMRKTIRKGQMWWASGPLIGGLVIAIFKNLPPEKTLVILAALSLALSLPMFFLYPSYFKMNTRKQIKNLCKASNSKGMQGLHEIDISDDYLAEKTEDNEIKIQWESINHIASTSDYTFVYIGEHTAHIIPKDNIVSGDYAQFVDKLKENYQKSQANQTINRTENASVLN